MTSAKSVTVASAVDDCADGGGGMDAIPLAENDVATTAVTSTTATITAIHEVVDVPLSTKHSLFWVTGESATGHQFYQVNETREVFRPWTYVIRHVLSVGGAPKLHEGPCLLGIPPHLSGIITSKQWSELWSPARMQSIQEGLVHAEQADSKCLKASVYLLYVAALANIMLKSWWSPHAEAAGCIVPYVTVALLLRWSYLDRARRRIGAEQSFSNVCHDMNTTWLSLHQHGWTAECHYEKWTSSLGPLTHDMQGFRLYFLPIQPRTPTLSSSRTNDQSKRSATSSDDAKTTANHPSLLTSILYQHGYVRILVSTTRKHSGSLPSAIAQWTNCAPLLVTPQGHSDHIDAPIAAQNENVPTNSTTAPCETTESPTMRVVDVGLLWSANDAAAAHMDTSHCMQTAEGNDRDDTTHRTNVGMANAWSLFWLDWQVAAARYNSTHRLALVVATAWGLYCASIPVVAFIMGQVSLRQWAVAVTGLVVVSAVWYLALNRKAAAFNSVHLVVQQHCFDFIQDNIFMELRTVASFQGCRMHPNRHCEGRLGYFGGVVGQGAASSMEFAHYLCLHRIPPKVVSSPRLAHPKTAM